jgi:hypothetical protein
MWKQTGISLFVCDKADFEPKLVQRGKQCHYILIEGTNHRDDIIIVNI